jgi:hypothetical protein
MTLKSRVQKLEEELGIAPDEPPRGRVLFIVYGEREECDIATARDDLRFERDTDESVGEFYERITNGLPVSGHTQVVYLWQEGPDTEPVPREPPKVEP